MVTTTMKDGGGDQMMAEDAVVMEVEHTENIEGTDHSKTKTTITPKNQQNSVIVVNDKKFEKELLVIDTELGRNVIVAVDISESQIKASNSEKIDGCFEIESGKVNAGVNFATDIIRVVDLGLNEKVALGSTITPPQIETCEGVEMDSFKLGPSNINLAQKSSAVTRNNTSTTVLKRNKNQSNKSGAQHSKGLESKENEGSSSPSLKGSPQRLTREFSTTMAMDGDSEEEGPKRKLVVPLGEVDQNMAHGKRVKVGIDEVSLGMIFKKFLGSVEVVAQPHWDECHE